MLNEILETRIMVKHAMKVWKDDPILQRILNARQFSLKMLANVTYGYAAAGIFLSFFLFFLNNCLSKKFE